MIKFIRVSSVWLWMIVLFILSSIPSTNLPHLDFVFADKMAHFVVYSVLGVLAAWFYVPDTANGSGKNQAFRNAFFLGIGYGFFDEVHQLFVPGRHFDMWDWLFDMCGVIAGILVFRYIMLRKSVMNSE